MTVIDIVRARLTEIGADGLCTDDCGCGIADLAPCGDWIGGCVPAVIADDYEGGVRWAVHEDDGPWFAPMEAS